jgi:hypothetical protein
MTVIPVEPGNRIQLPAEWAQNLGTQVVLDQTPDGILIRPYPKATWDDVFASRLIVGSAPQEDIDAKSEAAGNDLLF